MYRYRVRIEPLLSHSTQAPEDHNECVFEIDNHDDILAIVEAVRAKRIVDQGSSAALAVGLKLFSEVVLQHRKEAPFAEIWPDLQKFIKNLKAMPSAERIETEANIIES